MSPLANRYARVLFEFAQEQQNLEPVHEAMVSLGALIVQVKDFYLFVHNPLLAISERSRILTALFQGKVPPLVLQFLIFLTHKNRLYCLKDIVEAFDNAYFINTHQLRARVTLAMTPDAEDKILIDTHLKNKFQKRMVIDWHIDASLIGGFRIRVGDRLYDYSFKNQLNHFLQQATQPI